MGLDTTHNCWHGGYHSFNVWRNKVAEVAGYEIKKYNGFDAPVLDWDSITEENLMGNWGKLPSDPLIILFAHSDCNGYIQWRSTKKIAERLKEIEPKLEKGFFQDATRNFIKGLLKAHAQKEKVVFS